MPSQAPCKPVIEALESRICLSTLTYGFLGSTSSSPQPPWYSTGNVGDRHMMEAGVSAIPPVSGYVDGLGSGVTTTFTLDGIQEHTELELQVGVRGKQTYPIGGGGPGEEDPPPEGVWRFDVWFGEHHRWWNTDGSGWGGDPWQFVHHDESFAVTVKGTWLSAGSAPGWYLESASVLRYTPTVFMYEVDTATEGASYTTGNEPGFVIWRSGDGMLSALDVNLSDALGTATPGSDYTPLPSTATIPVGQSQVRVPVLPTDDVEREWTESVILELEDGDYYAPGTFSPVKVHIQDNDPVDIEADGLPEEWEDPEYNETNPGLHLVLNDDDDDNNGTIDGWDNPVPTFDDELEDVTLRFPDELKSHEGQQATVTLSLSERRFRVWYNGQLLLGGPESPYVPYGPLSVALDHAGLGPEMTVQVEFVPEAPPYQGAPYSEGLWEVVTGYLTLSAGDVGPRSSSSVDALLLQGMPIVIDIDDPALTADQEARYGAFVMINADNDNGSEVTEMWPATRDFELASGAQYAPGGIEDDLKELHLIARGTGLPVSVKLTWTFNWSIRTFRNANKSNEVQSGDVVTVNGQMPIYVEGTAISSSLKAIDITAQLQIDGLPVAADALRAAVGPVVDNSITNVIKHGPPGLLNANSDQMSADPIAHNQGQRAAFRIMHFFPYHPAYEPAAGQALPLNYVQTVANAGTSPHLTFGPVSNNRFVWQYVQGADAVLIDNDRNDGSFPYLHAQHLSTIHTDITGDKYLATSFNDTPGFGGYFDDQNNAPADTAATIRYRRQFRAYLVLPLGSVYYPIGYIDWWVDFAGTVQRAAGLFTFVPLAGINAVDATGFVLSAQKPNYTHYAASVPNRRLVAAQ